MLSWDDFLKKVADKHDLFDGDDRKAFLAKFAQESLDESKSDAQVATSLNISEVTLQRRLGKVYEAFNQSCPNLKSDKKGKFQTLRDWLKREYGNYQEPSNLTIDWRDICNKVLATQQLRRQATAQQYELNIYVTLGLMERPKTPNPRRNPTGEDSQPQEEPERPIVQTYKDDAFFQKVIAENHTEKRKHIAIIGEPGAGKTTLLGELAKRLPKNSPQFPICIRLADLRDSTIADYLLNNWLSKALQFIDFDAENVTPEIRKSFKQLFATGKVWLLLDGVDEMAATSPIEAFARIREQLTDWVGKARVVLTCRLNVWDAMISNPLTDFDTYKTLPLEPDDVDEFIRQWFEEASQDEKRRNSGNETFCREQGKRLTRQLKEPGKERIKELVRNPLRLSMLCQSWCVPEQELPETKAALYEQFTTYFFEWKQEEFQKKYQRVLTKTEKNKIKKVLAKLALAAMESANSFRIEEDFAIDQMEEEWFNLAEKLGWLVLVDRDIRTKEPIYSFLHSSFEEYFAALAIDENVNYWDFFLPRNHINRPVTGKRYRIFEPQWKEVILLWLGRQEEGLRKHKEEWLRKHKEEFIKIMVEFQDKCQDFYKKRAYFLAAQGIAEMGDFDMSTKIVEQLAAWSFDNSNLLWQEARKILEQTHRRKAIVVLQKLLENCENESTSVEIAYTLGQLEPNNKSAIRHLENLLETSKNKLLWQVAYNLEKIDNGNPDAITALFKLLQNSEHDEISKQAGYTLEEIGKDNPSVVSKLKELLSSRSVKIRNRAVDVLCNLNKSDPDIIAFYIERLDDSKSNSSRCVIARNLGEINTVSQDVVNVLNKLLDSRESEATRIRASESLSKLKSSKPENAIAVLKEISYNSQDYINKSWAARVLGNFDDAKQDAIEILKSLLHNKHPKVRRLAASELVELDKGNLDAIAVLIQLLLTCQEYEEIQRITNILRIIGKENTVVIDGLLQLMYNRQNDDRVVLLVASSLLKLAPSHQDAINPLSVLLNTCEDQIMQWRIADTLLELDNNNKNAIDVLTELLPTCRDESLIIDTIISLGKISKHNPNVVETLIDIVSNTNNENIFLVASSFLRSIKDFNSLKKIVFKLKGNLKEQIYKNQYKHYNECYELLWYCSQNLPYPDFYQAWHQDTLINTATANLNIANLPQVLAEAINNKPELCSKVKLICIDTHQIIDPENPAPEIYDLMLNQKCPEWQNGYPETMQKLKLYWNYLRRISEIPLFFICYDSTALSTTPTGFSLPFLTALSKFDGAICVVTSPPNPLSATERGSKNNSPSSVAGEGVRGWGSLQTFSPSQPNLIADIVGWMREKMIENL
ncbi:HEAT repeat domain-containing protein [Argonema antarcticum]|uniref:NACHT C-terminal alpha/beta 1 domain-containing protein n=1 Tax=Argonema antarcticum TaxID=2942763 RepID=UPI002010E6CF|nr:HEAT repeat domain-containing protein [Argonema antarcticum]MCL1471333.1 HEAT repeat domain-containing protein [Argonema antarcticum A004/B2]